MAFGGKSMESMALLQKGRGLSCKPNIYVSWSTSELRVRLAPLNRFKPSSNIFFLTVPRRYFFCGIFMIFFCLVFAMSMCASGYMCFVVTCWERADLLALVCGVLLWVCHFPISILGQVWYLIVSITDLCTLTYFASKVGCPAIKLGMRLIQNYDVCFQLRCFS